MKRIWIILLISLPYLLVAQGVKKANKKIARGEYEEAIAQYEKLLDKPKLAGEANFSIAEAYRQSNRILQAKAYYEAAIKSGYKKAIITLKKGQSIDLTTGI